MAASLGLRPSKGASMPFRGAVTKVARSAGAESVIRVGALTRVSGERAWDRPGSVVGLLRELAEAEEAESSIVLQARGDLLPLRGCGCWVHQVDEDVDGDGE